MNKRKTYGVRGLMEWQARLQHGRTVLIVDFTGGTLSGYGVSPALHTTDNAAVQQIIEHSEPWRRKKIFLVREEQIKEPATAPTPPTPTPTPQAEEKSDEKPNEPASYEATDESDAADYLHEKHKIDTLRLTTTKDIYREAQNLGIDLTINGNKG